MSAWFYMLKLRSGRLYTGSTTDIQSRYQDHCAGRGGRTTALDPPLTMVHNELFPCLADARRREFQVKRWSRAKKQALADQNISLLRQLAR